MKHETRQAEIFDWAQNHFGPVAADPRERGMRFLEEAIELAQSLGVGSATARALVTRCYSRPPGHPPKEIGQCGLTLEAAGECVGVNVNDAIRAEFDRILAVPDAEWKRRHDAKRQQGLTADAPPSAGAGVDNPSPGDA